MENTPESTMEYALQVQEKAANLGFEWEHVDQLFEKLQEEADELACEIENQDADKIESELGDLLFTCMNIARFLDCDPEEALHLATQKFEERVLLTEQLAKAKGLKFETLSPKDKNMLWDIAKKHLEQV